MTHGGLPERRGWGEGASGKGVTCVVVGGNWTSGVVDTGVELHIMSHT